MVLQLKQTHGLAKASTIAYNNMRTSDAQGKLNSNATFWNQVFHLLMKEQTTKQKASK
jgi:hypothetical protein